MTTFKQKNSKGFSLVEIMVAVTIGLVMIGFIIAIFTNSKRSYNVNTRTIEMNANMRFSFSLIESDLMNAGFYGGLNSFDTFLIPGGFSLDTCASGSIKFSTATEYPVWGKQASADPEISCLEGITSGTDYLIIHGVTGSTANDDSLFTDKLYIRTDAASGEFITVGLSSSIPNATNMNWEYYANIYYICQNRLLRKNLIFNTTTNLPEWETQVLIGSDKDNNDADISNGNPCSTDAKFAHDDAGVENMQIVYGVDSNSDGTSDYFADGNDLSTLNSWQNVVEVKVALLIRSDKDANYKDIDDDGDQNTYQMVNLTYTPADSNYHRKLLTKTFFLSNNWFSIINDPAPL